MTLLVALGVVFKNSFFLLVALMPFMAGAAIADDDFKPSLTKACFVMAGIFAQIYWCTKGWPQ